MLMVALCFGWGVNRSISYFWSCNLTVDIMIMYVVFVYVPVPPCFSGLFKKVGKCCGDVGRICSRFVCTWAFDVLW
jgi:hypothetical protein